MKMNNSQIQWYPGHMAKTKRLVKEQLDLIDIVYEVIDARMPYSSKIKDIDEVIKNKPRILIMTKYDLCDKKETDKWIKYYEEKIFRIADKLLFCLGARGCARVQNGLVQYTRQKR